MRRCSRPAAPFLLANTGKKKWTIHKESITIFI